MVYSSLRPWLVKVSGLVYDFLAHQEAHGAQRLSNPQKADLSFLAHVSDLVSGGESQRARREKKQSFYGQYEDSTSARPHAKSQAPVRVVSQDNLAKLMMRRLKDCLNHNALQAER